MKLLPQLPRLSKKKRPLKTAPSEKVVHAPIPLPGDLLRRLNALRRKYRSVRIMTGLSMLVGAISLLLLIQGASDWWFDLPWFARLILLVVDIAVLVWIYRQYLSAALRTKLSLPHAALLVERKWPQLRQSLITAVHLGEGKTYSTRGSGQLLQLTFEQARARSANLKFVDVVPTRNLKRWALAAATSFLLAGALAAYSFPASLALLERIFLLNVPLPTKTIVVPITKDLAVSVGSDVELSAMAQGIIPAHGRLTVTYVGSAPQEFPLDPTPDKPTTFAFTLRNVQSDFKYSFTLNDGHSPEFSVTAKVPPSLSDITCEQTFPSYAGTPPRQLPPTDLTLLAGSHLKVKAHSTTPLKSATVILQGLTQTIPATLDPTGTHVEVDIPIPAKDLTGFSFHLVEQTGVPSINETVYPILLVPDAPPVVKIIEPSQDNETITLRAKPLISFDASDDFGITSLVIKYQLVPPLVAGAQQPITASAVQAIPLKINAPENGTHYEYILDVGAQLPPWQEGYVVNYWIEATDNNTATGPGVTKTEHKQFGILSLEAKQAEIHERLKQDADDIDKISNAEQKLNDDVGESIPQKK